MQCTNTSAGVEVGYGRGTGLVAWVGLRCRNGSVIINVIKK